MNETTLNYVRFLRGTQSAYDSLVTKEKDTVYFITESGKATGKIYLGEVLMSGEASEEDVVKYLSDLADVDTTGAIDNSILVFDANRDKWVVADLEDVFEIPVLTAATNVVDGNGGIVPAPKAGYNKRFLRGDATWSALTISDVDQLQAQLDELVSKSAFNEGLSTKVETSELNAVLVQLNSAIGGKVDKDSVYTKTETDSVVAAAVTKASHLQRKVVTSTQDIYNYVENNEDADSYIFMVPSGLTADDNKYYEYIVVYDENKVPSVEKVGNWEVSLENYVTAKDLENALNGKVDKVYFSVPVLDENGNPVYEEDGVTPKTETVEGSLLSPTDKDKLDALVVTEDGVQISGTVNAANVQGLNEWITANRNIVPGLFPSETETAVEQAISSLNDLIGVVNTNHSSVNERIDGVVSQLNNYVTFVEYNESIKNITKDVDILKAAMSWGII